MKTVVSVLMVLVLSVTVSLAKTKESNSSHLKIIAVKSHSIYFKVHHSFVGGTVEVYDANQNLLESEDLTHTHTMVFFHEKPSGKYFIKVKKRGKTIEFGYVNI
jgi:hypothetical protein